MRIPTLLLLCVGVCLTSPYAIRENGPAAISVIVKEGEDANLPCSISTGENIVGALFDWKKEDQKKKDGLEVFLYNAGVHYNNGRHGQDEQFKGRVFHFQDKLKHGVASIIIKNTKISDRGIYTCDFPRLSNGQKFYVELVVGAIDRDRSGEIRGAARKPYITTNITIDGLLLLQCDVQDASPKPEVEWQDSAGNILTAEEPQVTERGDRWDVSLLTTVTKSDHFRCVVRQKGINHTISAEIYMPFPGAAAKPNTRNLGPTEGGVLLQCEVLGASPKPDVEWQDKAGNILHAEEPQVTERGGSYDVILKTTVTKTDRYRCVVKQKEIHHEISTETYVSVPEKRCDDWAAWLFGGLFGGAAILIAVQALLVFTKCITISRKKGSEQRNGLSARYSAVPPRTESQQNGNGSPPERNGSCNGVSHVPLKTQTPLEP